MPKSEDKQKNAKYKKANAIAWGCGLENKSIHKFMYMKILHLYQRRQNMLAETDIQIS